MLLRDAQLDDLGRVLEIYAHAVEHGIASFETEVPSSAELERRWRAVVDVGLPWIVAEADGVLLGYAYAVPYRARPAYRYTVEESVYVAPEAQRRGVGRALLVELIERCRASGKRQMLAVVGGGDEHPASVGLHESVGFVRVGTLRRVGFKFERWLDTLILQLDLESR